MKSILAKVKRVIALRATERELRELSDHMLRDLGLRRDQLSRELLRRLCQ
ncbi:MAG: hypothetical protein K0R40_1302 [Burkholderiales bacterium]|nr:hypothetical protein [Burkholderiales bacterium]